jgi:hypothetical protein
MLVSPLSPADSPGRPEAGAGDAQLCPGQEITILHDNAPDFAREACRAAEIALGFMASYGFDTDISVRVRIVNSPVVLHAVEASGTFDAGASLIAIPSYEHCCGWSTEQRAFGLDATRDLWRSFVVHELAHAVAHINFRTPKVPRVSHEYIAYVVQIATMPPPLIEQILGKYPNRAFASERAINHHFLDLDPQIFAVKAYRHFLALDDGAAFFARILKGDFRQFERD